MPTYLQVDTSEVVGLPWKIANWHTWRGWLAGAVLLIFNGLVAMAADGWLPGVAGLPVGAVCLLLAWVRRPRRQPVDDSRRSTLAGPVAPDSGPGDRS